jgi:cytochrome c2
MRYLRSQVMALGEQRELMQVNYPYLGVIGEEINAVTQYLAQGHLIGSDHQAGIMAIQQQSQNLLQQAANQDPMALSTANMIQKRCATCHSQSSATSGIGWDQIFKNDWETISKNCSKEGRTPYLCRSMNGMMTAYAGIYSAANLGRQNYEALKHSAKEMARIAEDLRDKKMMHGSEEIIGEVHLRAEEVVQLATQQRPEAFEKGMLITQACMQCHANYSTSARRLNFKSLR